jgi:hypothetical protein
MEEFLDILNEINLADEAQDQIVEHNNKNEQVKSLKKSIKTIVQYSRLLRSSRSALKATTQHHQGTSFNYHTQQAFSTLLDQSLQLAHSKNPTGSETFQGVNIPRRLFQRGFTRHQKNQHLQGNLTKRLRQHDQHQTKQDYQLPRPNRDVTYNHPNHIWKQKIPSRPMTASQFNQHRNQLRPKSRTRRNINMTQAPRQDYPCYYKATGKRPPSNKIIYDDDNPQHQQPTNMTRRRPFDTTYHAAYMTRIFTEPAKLTEVESRTPTSSPRTEM